MSANEPSERTGRNFIEEIIDDDLARGRCATVRTRFPPEPNGYLHIGHAKSICLNFGLAEKYGGLCNLRFDDTNPTKEEQEFVESIEESVRWLGFDWAERRFFASDYFERLYEWAQLLVKKGKAYVCDLSAEEIRRTRGTPTEPGVESPYRDRSVEENLDLLERMRKGEFPDGSRTLRAKIDMASPNTYLRDPVMYRIVRARHHRTGERWCIYPTYDWAHGQSDAIEGITHSICTLEFENHRPLYDWFLREIGVDNPPRQIEFAPLDLTHTVLSKRVLRRLVEEGRVRGWDDPRMPTLVGLRRRGYTPEAIRSFCARIGVSKVEATIDVAWLEDALREHLNRVAPRRMAVLRPLRLTLVDWPEERVEWVEAVNNPEDPGAGTRRLPLTRELFVERDDFLLDPPKKWHRLAPGREVRLRAALVVTCREVVRDEASGEVVELRCTHDPTSLGGQPADGRKVRGTLHWVSARHAVGAEVRLYDHLFSNPRPLEGLEDGDVVERLNPDSLVVVPDARLEPALADAAVGERFQFERLGYFCVDPDSAPGRLVFNRACTLRDTWAKLRRKDA